MLPLNRLLIRPTDNTTTTLPITNTVATDTKCNESRCYFDDDIREPTVTSESSKHDDIK